MDSSLFPTSSLIGIGFFVVLSIGLIVWQLPELTLVFLTAIARSLVQLLVLGLLIAVVWESHNPWVLGIVLLLMMTVAAIAARQRINHSGAYILPWIWGAMGFSSGIALIYTNLFVLQGQAGLAPQFWLPLAGLAFHQTLNSMALTGEYLMQQISANRVAIETHLTLGASPQQAIAAYQQAAVRAVFLPMVNNMKVLGLVSLPTLMAGQLLSGTSPLEAAINQFLILLMLACITLVSSLLLAWGLSRQAFNRFDQLSDDAF